MFAEFYWGHSPIDYLDGADTETDDKVAYVDADIVVDPFCMNVSFSCQLLLDRILTDGFSPALIPWGKPNKGFSGMCQWCQERGVANTSCEHRVRDGPNESSHHGWDLFVAPAIDNDIVDNGIVPVDTEDDEFQAQSLFVDAFLHNNRLEHLIQLMGYHPKYLDCFLKTQQYILRGDGPLPTPYRHYIAIMAAGRHQCSYLINIQRTEFLLQGGDEKWLNGLEHIPAKLRNLYEINKLMAHRPWLINKSHIEKLTRGEDNWSLSELMQAVVILAQFHALCSFVYGCGINPEIDHEDGHSSRPVSVSDASVVENSSTTVLSSPGLSQNSSHSCTPNSPEGESCIEQLLQRMRQLTEEAQVEMTQEELLKRFQRVEDQNAELVPVAKQPSPQADILRYVDDANFVYQDFAKRGHTTEIPTFRALDYSWEEQGFSLANRLYPEIGLLLDEKFTTTYNLTYNTMGQKANVDTSAFRRAIWNYIHCLFGIRHDDYNYSEVNQLLERPLKNYIKIVTCFPERVSKKDYDSYMREFQHSEKVHINLMLLEARVQGELLYALRAIMKHMT